MFVIARRQLLRVRGDKVPVHIKAVFALPQLAEPAHLLVVVIAQEAVRLCPHKAAMVNIVLRHARQRVPVGVGPALRGLLPRLPLVGDEDYRRTTHISKLQHVIPFVHHAVKRGPLDRHDRAVAKARAARHITAEQ